MIYKGGAWNHFRMAASIFFLIIDDVAVAANEMFP